MQDIEIRNSLEHAGNWIAIRWTNEQKMNSFKVGEWEKKRKRLLKLQMQTYYIIWVLMDEINMVEIVECSLEKKKKNKMENEHENFYFFFCWIF